MTTKEFSDAFDTLVNSYSGGIAFDEYEKSLFLTMAQEQIVIELYTGRNIKTASFERTEELRLNLRNLIKTDILDEDTSEHKGISKYSKFFKLPPDALFITYESATINDGSAECRDGAEITVTPVTQDEFYRVMNNPFRMVSDRRALRLDNGLDIIEIVTKYNIKDYTIRYLSKPTPIVLANFADEYGGVTIDGFNEITECKLDSTMHQYILEKAVALAIASKGILNKNNV